MIKTPHTTQVLQAMPSAKAEEKKGKTKTGTVMVLFGVMLVVAAIGLALRVIDSEAGLTFVSLILILGPVGLGVVLCVAGATVWSGELVTAGFKDALGTLGGVVGGIVGAFRKGGGTP